VLERAANTNHVVEKCDPLRFPELVWLTHMATEQQHTPARYMLLALQPQAANAQVRNKIPLAVVLTWTRHFGAHGAGFASNMDDRDRSVRSNRWLSRRLEGLAKPPSLHDARRPRDQARQPQVEVDICSKRNSQRSHWCGRVQHPVLTTAEAKSGLAAAFGVKHVEVDRGCAVQRTSW
jgi:hypothetical protein